MELVGLRDIEQAAGHVRGVAVHTPLLPATWAEEGRPLWLKPESLQPGGAFKIRGATTKVAALSQAERETGLVAHSSGNHAQAVAQAARSHRVKAVVVMPDTAPRMKVEATRRLGAEVVLVPPAERYHRADELADAHGYTPIPPYDDPWIIAGQGTVGLEIAEDLPQLSTVLVPISGGGLISGVATAIKERLPHVRVIGVEPELAADAAESFRRGEPVTWPAERTQRTIADGLRVNRVGDLPWVHIRRYVDDIVTVSEDQIREAVRVLAARSRLVAEPSGAVATAAYLFRAEQLRLRGDTVAVVSGGNIELDRFRAILAGAPRG
ncbi:threonine ammonia-lyase [Ornithinicoccus halotolerans]|uniref:threonine ammonia-lyase n=1 Tax=Ornithinicoccus halotolerans TaxID=1748220 RepID=UPI0012957C6A|nr:threonine/serine dehydratase [Ornithinicoccus halotolerans]